MKKNLLFLLLALSLLGVGLSGCHNDSSLTPQEKTQFGHPGMPPPAAYYQAMKNTPHQPAGTPANTPKSGQ
jgi:hypothetical protein